MFVADKTIEIDLPFPPSANRLWRNSGGRMHISPQYALWKKEAGYQILAQRKGGLPEGPYKITIHAKRPDKRRRDLGNLEKAVSDLLVSVGTIPDDSNCEMITLRWVTAGEGVYVRVEPAGVE